MSGGGNPYHDPKTGEFTTGPGAVGGAHEHSNHANRLSAEQIRKTHKALAETKAQIAAAGGFRHMSEQEKAKYLDFLHGHAQKLSAMLK